MILYKSISAFTWAVGQPKWVRSGRNASGIRVKWDERLSLEWAGNYRSTHVQITMAPSLFFTCEMQLAKSSISMQNARIPAYGAPKGTKMYTFYSSQQASKNFLQYIHFISTYRIGKISQKCKSTPLNPYHAKIYRIIYAMKNYGIKGITCKLYLK